MQEAEHKVEIEALHAFGPDYLWRLLMHKILRSAEANDDEHDLNASSPLTSDERTETPDNRSALDAHDDDDDDDDDEWQVQCGADMFGFF